MNEQTVIEGVTPPIAPKPTVETVKAAILAFILLHDFDWGDADLAAQDIAENHIVGMDGYALAKRLEFNCGWGGLVAQDVEDLDCISDVLRDSEEDARKEWVKKWDIKPELPIGTTISHGIITGVYEYGAAQYLVKENGCTQDGRHLIVKFEDAIVVNSSQASI